MGNTIDVRTGSSSLQSRKLRRAVLHYDKALAIDPKDEDALSNKATALGKSGNYAGVILYILHSVASKLS